MLTSYIPVIAQLALSIVTITVILGLAWLAPKFQNTPRRDEAKEATYECGIQPAGSARERFNVRYYIVAMLFILFDIEVVFLYPWAVIYREVITASGFIFWEVVIFAAVLLVGLAYVWRVGALRWD